MNQSIRIFLSTYFIFIALLYLAMRYSTFSMNPILYTLMASLLIIAVIILYVKGQIEPDIFTVSIVVLPVLMMLSLAV
ncbi:hypothetical protein [Salinicoccus halitifaciens]|uniref:Uncharacterized protein n=1 Tax=Salinicoccus halitifaciens TaxID=1073415 RepID=A0ABV2E626_9STAP|nr:hypothetical protein [Salinicoccus halitifaciens]MCD2137079.1 hypothetical protein [Salinicoccus halitifaciens]